MTARAREVPSLLSLCADKLAAAAHGLTPEHLQGIGETLSTLLLSRIVAQQRLDFRIAKAFLGSGHPSIVAALGEIDLLAGMVAVSPTPCRPVG